MKNSLVTQQGKRRSSPGGSFAPYPSRGYPTCPKRGYSSNAVITLFEQFPRYYRLFCVVHREPTADTARVFHSDLSRRFSIAFAGSGSRPEDPPAGAPSTCRATRLGVRSPHSYWVWQRSIRVDRGDWRLAAVLAFAGLLQSAPGGRLWVRSFFVS